MPGVLSSRKKFIFVHVPKTGGTSVWTALRPFEDYHRVKKSYRRLVNRLFDQPRRRQLIAPTHFGHSTAEEIKAEVPDFENYFSFGFVRNPWDIIVSNYEYARTEVTHPGHNEVIQLDFETFVRKRQRAYRQHRFLCNADGQVLVSFVGRFERLRDDFEEICNKLDLDIELKHVFPGGHTHKPRDYRDYYTPELRDLVAANQETDIKLFGYTF